MTKRFQPRGTANFSSVNTSGSSPSGPAGLSQSASQDTITARAGGGQASATQLTSRISKVTTVATAADSVKLPVSAPGLMLTVINGSSNAMQVFGTSPDTINGNATGTGVSVPAGKVAEFIAASAGAWHMNLSA